MPEEHQAHHEIGQRNCQTGLIEVVAHHLRPFDGFDLHFAQTYLPMKVADLIPQAVEPQ